MIINKNDNGCKSNFEGRVNMCESVLEYLKKNNQFPIIFIGPEIPKRYLNNYPNCLELLEELWNISNSSEDFYGHLTQIRDEIIDGDIEGILEDEEIDHRINTLVASKIEKNINTLFNKGQITIEGLTTKDVYFNKISPFKKSISNKFSEYEKKDNVGYEYNQFKNMLYKAQVIMTTNYDSFIEDTYNLNNNNKINVYNGETGMFISSTGYAELYKLHGSYQESNSIIITKEDYQKFNKSSISISLKIITLLFNSPIIFLGYSLKDINIRKIIKNFVSLLSSNEKEILEKRLIFVSRKQGENEIIERVENSLELGCRYRVIETDNYIKIYDSICKIEQGVSPIEISKYIKSIKKIIVETGERGRLDTILVNNGNLDSLNNSDLNDEELGVGNKEYIFVMPTEARYSRDYINGMYAKNVTDIFRFIISKIGRLPFKKYITEENIRECELNDNEKKKLTVKIKKYDTIESLIAGISAYSIDYYSSIKDIVAAGYRPYMEYNTIIHNCNNIDINELKEYILDKLNDYIEKNEDLDSIFRKLLIIYDLKT